MNFGEIIPYIITALGGGSAGWLVNWKWGRRKEAANVKSDEIETMKKAMEDFYDPLLKKQNARIAELEGEVKTLRDQLAYERTEHQKQIESQNQQIAALQKQITEITRALGIKAARQVRNNKGQFTSEKVEEPSNED
jgi:small-conductance mechanosensitive channel